MPEEKPGARFLLGALALNGLLALEVPLLYRLMGRADATLDWRPFVYGMGVTMFVAYLLQASRTKRPRENACANPASSEEVPALATPARILARAGVNDVADVLSVHAEDHYCRLVLRGGGSALVHYRFKDAVDELGDEDGVQVHRGVWVADHAVSGSRRLGRRWSLQLVDGAEVAVSETRVALCRSRGWMKASDGLA
jgi:DNA-binding LytR/AlgR family response regulator